MSGFRRVCAHAITLACIACFGGAALADISSVLPMCVNCHGEDGLGMQSDVPIIAGIPAVVQEDAVFAYIDGARDCGDKPLMCGIVGRLTDDQVAELADHYAAMPYVPAGEEYDATLAEQGRETHAASCAICHGDDPGSGESSILYGQRKDYLRFSMTQYAEGDREQLPAMESKMRALSADDIEALLNYYASYRE